MMESEIGATAGAIWQTLRGNGELTLPELKKKIAGKTPMFDWAIGWLARENKIAIKRAKRSFVVHLKEAHS
jgi:hypothetical protein